MIHDLIPAHTPSADTGLAGAWHISGWLCVRADLALGAPGALGGVQWLDEVSPAMWATLADAQWMATPEGKTARPGDTLTTWHQVAHVLVAPCGRDIVRLSAGVRPVLYRPDGTARRCRLVEPPGGGGRLVVVHDGGEVVAFVPEMSA